MRKLLMFITIAVCLCLCSTFIFTACAPKTILVITREAGSGTRDAFDTLIKNENGDSLAKKADGTNQPTDLFISNINILESTAQVVTKVASTKNAIGYISLGSVDESVKAISVNGVAPSSATVLDGTYALKRPFVIVTKKDQNLTTATADFMSYLKSKDAQEIVASSYIKQDNDSKTAYVVPAAPLTGTIKLRGSTSIEPLMKSLIQAYKTRGGSAVSAIVFDLDALGSSPGITATKGDTEGNIIGMSSSALKSADKEVLEEFDIALDAVAIIVNNDNSITNLTIAQIFDIYTGKLTSFADIK
ncbi:MAG: substrate-binding domain-containing protein [Christensenellaceae bacterium]|nr:substrate-binding domain-containing protein [Christensenellaceae bacterium]